MLVAISGKKNSGKDTVGSILKYLLINKETKRKPSFEEFSRGDWKNIYNHNFIKIKKFSDKLKDIVCILLNCTRKQLEDPLYKEKELGEEWWYYNFGENSDNSHFSIKMPYLNSVYEKGKEPLKYLVKLTPRKLMQLIGTECGREILHPNIWINSLFVDYLPSYAKGDISKAYQVDIPFWIITDLRFPNELEAVKERNGITIRINRPSDKVDPHLSERALDDYQDWDHTIENNEGLEKLYGEVVKIFKKHEKIYS